MVARRQQRQASHHQRRDGAPRVPNERAGRCLDDAAKHEKTVQDDGTNDDEGRLAVTRLWEGLFCRCLASHVNSGAGECRTVALLYVLAHRSLSVLAQGNCCKYLEATPGDHATTVRGSPCTAEAKQVRTSCSLVEVSGNWNRR